jgi:hypothetical protein
LNSRGYWVGEEMEIPHEGGWLMIAWNYNPTNEEQEKCKKTL